MASFTKYQIALMLGEKIILHLRYSERHTKGALLNTMLAYGPEIIEAAKWTSDTDEFHWDSANKCWQLPTGYKVAFTGKTETMK